MNDDIYIDFISTCYRISSIDRLIIYLKGHENVIWFDSNQFDLKPSLDLSLFFVNTIQINLDIFNKFFSSFFYISFLSLYINIFLLILSKHFSAQFWSLVVMMMLNIYLQIFFSSFSLFF